MAVFKRIGHAAAGVGHIAATPLHYAGGSLQGAIKADVQTAKNIGHNVKGAVKSAVTLHPIKAAKYAAAAVGNVITAPIHEIAGGVAGGIHGVKTGIRKSGSHFGKAFGRAKPMMLVNH